VTGFRYADYEAMLRGLLAAGYQFVTLREYFAGDTPPDTKIVVNRIDVDGKVERLRSFRPILRSLGVRASIYPRLHADAYNLLNFGTLRLLRDLAADGHEIGLHTEIMDAQGFCEVDGATLLRTEISLLEMLLGTKVYGTASHGDMTSHNNLDFWKTNVPGDFGLDYEAYQGRLWKNCRYVSDSEWTRWKAYDNGELRQDDRRSPQAASSICSRIPKVGMIITSMNNRVGTNRTMAGERGSDLYQDLLPLLTPYGREFLELEYGRGEEAYRARIAYIGLENCGRVLDAGGGIGQWAIALARSNREVEVLDLMTDRLLIGHALAARQGVGNVQFRQGSIETLPYESGSFDAIICYSVFMFANGRRTTREFMRVLRPGGRLYVMIDLWRWYAKQFASPRRWRQGAVLFAKSLLGRGPRFYTPASFSALLTCNGFDIVSEGQEGHATFNAIDTEQAGRYSFYPDAPSGREQLWELCAIRR